MRRAGCFAVFALLVASGAALAETTPPRACLPPNIEIQAPPAQIRVGETFILQLSIGNPNLASSAPSVTVHVNATAPAGWAVTPVQPTLSLGPQNVTFDPLTVIAPAAGTGAASGHVSIRVQLQCHSATGLESTSVSTKQFAVAVDQPQVPWVEVGAFAVGILLVILAWIVLRGRGGGVSVFAEVRAKDAPPGKGVSFPIVVQNRRREPNSIKLAVDPVPPGWGAFLALSDIDLDAKEQRSLWLMVTPPADAVPGTELDVRVAVTSEYFPEDESSVRVRATVAAGGKRPERT
ncbi:MAG: COG1470 family protein [Thermoplasmatota archaeon]